MNERTARVPASTPSTAPPPRDSHMTQDPALSDPGNAPMRARLNRITLDPDVGHDGERITEMARSLRLAISDEHVARLKVAPHLAADYSPSPPRVPACMSVPERTEAQPSYATARGVQLDPASASRFAGTWC